MSDMVTALMTIKLSEEFVHKYDPSNSIMEWWAASKQHRRPGTKPYGPRCKDDISLQENSDSDSGNE